MLILASQSPRRAELLKAAGIEFVTLPVDIDESLRHGETPTEHVKRLAEEKARAAAARTDVQAPLVLGADTVVVVGPHILGKPRDPGDALRMLQLLSGHAHEVLTGVAVVTTEDTQVEVARTTVQFAPLSNAEMSWYVSTGEPMDKAGGYAIQGLASRFIERIDGSYSNVVGLPVALVYKLLRRYPER